MGSLSIVGRRTISAVWPECECCMCGRWRRPVVLLEVDGLCSTPGKGWACEPCGLTPGGAQAVVCMECAAKCEGDEAALKWVCMGAPEWPGRTPASQVRGSRRHDLLRHAVNGHGFLEGGD